MSDTTPRDQLEQIIEKDFYDGGGGLLSQEDEEMGIRQMADAILAAGFRPPARVVTTWEEVQSLREGALILIKRWGHMLVYERQKGDAWYLQGGGWLDEDLLPATVIYEPEEGEGAGLGDGAAGLLIGKRHGETSGNETTQYVPT